MVVETGARLGVAFDGDGDRAIFVDHVRAGRQRRRGAAHVRAPPAAREPAPGNAIVATVMSNIGLEIALRDRHRDRPLPGGDKYVMEEMLARGLALGGEQSGHVIFSDYLFTGDGLCTALNVLSTLARADGRWPNWPTTS